MSDETLDITNTGNENATINLLKIDVNQNSNNQRILSILSLLLSFVAVDINDNEHLYRLYWKVPQIKWTGVTIGSWLDLCGFSYFLKLTTFSGKPQNKAKRRD